MPGSYLTAANRSFFFLAWAVSLLCNMTAEQRTASCELWIKTFVHSTLFRGNKVQFLKAWEFTKSSKHPISQTKIQSCPVTSASTQSALTSCHGALGSSWINNRLQIHQKNRQIMCNNKYTWDNCTVLADSSLEKKSRNWSNELFVTNYLPNTSCDVRPWGGE